MQSEEGDESRKIEGGVVLPEKHGSPYDGEISLPACYADG